MATSFWATVFNVIFGLVRRLRLSRYNFWGRNALIVTISLPTAIPTAVAGFASVALVGTIRHARPFAGAARHSSHVHCRRDHPGKYLRDFSARFRRYQAGLRHDEPFA